MTSSPQTILFFDHTAAWSGGEISLYRLVTGLDPLRYRARVILGAEGPLAARMREQGVAVEILPLSPKVSQVRKDSLGGRSFALFSAIGASVAYTLRLRALIRRVKPVIVFTNSLKSDILGAFATRGTGARLLWCIRDRISDDYLPSKVVRVFRWLARLLPHALVANSESTMETLRLPKQWKNVRTFVVHCGVPIPPVARTNPIPETTVGIIGRLTRWKGQEIFLRAVALLAPRFSSVRFKVIGGALFGEEHYADSLGQLTTKLGLDKQVEFMGFRNDMDAVLRELDIVVHASITPEPFGLVVAEAMAAGKAVVASRGGGVLEMVEDGVTGLLVDIGNVEGLASALARLFDDAALRASLGENARRYAVEALSQERMCAKMARVFELVAPVRKRQLVPVPKAVLQSSKP